jgi:hypothetical protein
MTAKQILGKISQAKGQSFEIKVHNKLKRHPDTIMSCRSSGSKGFADHYTIRGKFKKNGILVLTLCKTNGYLEPKERKQINEMLKMLPKILVPQMELRYYKSKRKMGKMIIDSNWEIRYNKLKPYQEI